MGKESDTFRLRRLGLHDVSKAILLSDNESWNQTEHDWAFLIENLENLCLGVFDNDRLIGTATALNYDYVTWIGMVLVDKNYRGRGISKTLLSNIIKGIKPSQSIKLDATPAGQKVYAKFGFQEEYEILRMTATCASSKTLNSPDNENIRLITYKDIANISAYDKTAFGANRKELIAFLFSNNRKKSFVVEKNGKIEGFILGRSGSKYYHMGPLMASSPEIGEVLILKALNELESQPVLLDIVADKKDQISFLKGIGFSKKRHFIRMYQKENPASGLLGTQYLIAGPEYG
ncbi:GNAT family N-acetyltransferase [Kriegella aquimaris]|uniref:Acetyltransferase (GNAT) domain-containing protein n=1 Tax=Kriegella aquimaris TaxID=192904 RepID=A0A1G9S7L5_9FLAO|nr:GNAT family N-acetyltransferase [Kriegella aquimaris]SDM31422.1 Acetyltransferase (GNAT) domain-containing protein [Kriegella aquimaris]